MGHTSDGGLGEGASGRRRTRARYLDGCSMAGRRRIWRSISSARSSACEDGDDEDSVGDATADKEDAVVVVWDKRMGALYGVSAHQYALN